MYSGNNKMDRNNFKTRYKMEPKINIWSFICSFFYLPKSID